MPGTTEAELRTADGVELAASIYEGSAPVTAMVVLVHGFAATRQEAAIASTARMLARSNMSVLVYDSRGHGESTGACTLGEAERLDVAAAVAEAARSDLPVVLAGVSMGGVAAVRYMTAHPEDTPTDGRSEVAGLATVSTPARWRFKPSIVGTYVRLITTTRAGRALAARHPGVRIAADQIRPPEPAEVIPAVAKPTAFLHGAEDSMIPASDAAELYEAATEPRRLEIVAGMSHGVTERGSEALALVCGWVLDGGVNR